MAPCSPARTSRRSGIELTSSRPRRGTDQPARLAVAMDAKGEMPISYRHERPKRSRGPQLLRIWVKDGYESISEWHSQDFPPSIEERASAQ